MLYDLEEGIVRCASCGSIRFTVAETYEVAVGNNPNFDKTYIMHNQHKVLKCANCGKIMDESSLDKQISWEHHHE